jgi:hypothetical protein
MHTEILEKEKRIICSRLSILTTIDVIDGRSSDKKGSFQSGLSEGRAVSHGNSFLYFYFETQIDR